MVASGNRPDRGLSGIELDNIHKRFDKLEVLNGLTLAIPNGELCCLLGPSGCGKTTVLKIIDGILEVDEGKIFLLGRDVTDTPAQNRKLGMVFQNYALFPHMNVYDNIAYGLRRRHMPEQRISQKVNSSLELVKLQGVEKRRPHELSGGQQQRVALARALVIEPQALLLDEPLSNLDARLRVEMRLEIHRIQKHLGITTVYVTHDQEEAMSIADRIVLMNGGRIEQVGSPEEIYEKPATRFVADFIGDINFIEGEVRNGELVLLGKRFALDDTQIQNGQKITCGLRPERIRLAPDGESEISGTVREAVYFGSVMRYRVSANGRTPASDLNVELPASHLVFSAGDRVGINFSKDDIRFFQN